MKKALSLKLIYQQSSKNIAEGVMKMVKDDHHKNNSSNIVHIFGEDNESIVADLISLSYQVEISILRDGDIPDELLTDIKKNVSLLTQANKGSDSKISLPEQFKIEYENLYDRVERIILKTITQIKKLEKNTSGGAFLKESKIRLERLCMLKAHYKWMLDFSS